MSVSFGSGQTHVSQVWTSFKSLVSAKSLSIQYDDDGVVYTIFAYDNPVVYITTIWKGTVPDGVIAGGYSQAQNDTDKSDFETTYQPTANAAIVIRTELSSTTTERATYSVEAALAGANNKDMLCIFNPSGSGKVLRIYEVWATVPASSGATVIIPFEMRKTTTLTGGSAATKMKWDSNDANAVADVRSAPTGLTDGGLWYTFVEQINTAQGSTAAHTETVHEGENTSGLKPLVLRPDQGLYLKQIANNTSTFRVGVLWTEDTT